MVDERAQDKFASIIDHCRCTSSQEELLSHAKFAREDETFSDNDEAPLPEVENITPKLDGVGDSEKKRDCKSVVGDADNEGSENPGFRGERKRAIEGESSKETELEGREFEPQLKKTRVSPLVHCSGKVVIEEEDNGKKQKVIAVSGDFVVEMRNSSKSAAVPENADCTEKLDSEMLEDDVGVEGKDNEESGVKKKLEFVLDTEVIDRNDEEEIEGDTNKEKREGHGEGSGNVEGDGEQGDDKSVRGEEEEEDAMARRKRELPPSIFWRGWGEEPRGRNGNEDGNGNGNGDENGNGDGDENRDGNGNGDVDGDSNKMNEETKRDGETKGSEDVGWKCIMDVLRAIVASEECCNDNRKIDFLETAKRRGMTFPRSRFLSKVEEQ